MTKDRILVAFDGSAAGVAALEKAVAITEMDDASIDLLYVIDTRSYQVGFAQQPDVDGTILYNAETRAEIELEEQAKPLRARGIEVRTHLRFGNPRTVVALDAPKDYDSSLIILGRSSKRLTSRMFIGSVASFVTENAPCDVLIVANPNA
ncbi:universal stress protein [Lacticaseibacillus hegangensis]|uniref:Universal stress protein n=1 Tax=Lacticaseibacillus hegangensis TaxID=2486010 RepID=A0ABW4CUS6_9LACO|nr:universal stress protein [Lacticaseibacillus hegangensis]